MMKKELLLLIAAALVASAAAAQAKETISLSAGLGAGFTDNVLQYSDQQLADFDAGTKPNQFSIRTSDDMLWLPSLGLEYQNERPRGRATELSLRGSGEWHDKNATADWGALGATWRETFGRGRRLSVSAYRLPHYYLRQLWDDDFVPTYAGQGKYRRAEFALTIFGARWKQRLAEGLSADLGWQNESRVYNADFRERDSKLNQGELGLDWTKPKRLSFSADLGYEKSSAEASDGDDAGLAVPDDPDVSFHAVLFGAGTRARLAQSARVKLDGDLSVEFEKRTYDSDRVADRYHRGRKDTKTTIDAGLRLGFRRHWSARASFRHETNDAVLGASAPASADAGSFTENRGSLALEWTNDVWHRFRKRSTGTPAAR